MLLMNNNDIEIMNVPNAILYICSFFQKSAVYNVAEIIVSMRERLLIFLK